jgi:predicted transposase YbfD/YdcC
MQHLVVIAGNLRCDHPGLPRECEELFTWLRGPHPLDEEVVLGYNEQVDGGHGRIETRRVWSTEALAGLETCERWPGLATLVMVEATRQIGEQESLERRYYISSLPGTTNSDAQHLNGVIRTHWEIENRVHWVLDVAMGEDTTRTRKGESAQNLALIRKLALNLWRRETSVPAGIAAKQKRAGWDHSYLLKILTLQRHFSALTKFAHVESRFCGRKRRGKAALEVPINPCAGSVCSRSVAVGLTQT